MLNALKAGTVLVCTVCFILNSLETFHKYFKGSQLVLQSSQAEAELPLPLLVLCPESAFREVTKDGIMGWSKQQYLEETTDPANIKVANIKLWKMDDASQDDSEDMDSYKLENLNTMFTGRCLTIQFNQTVS